MKIIRLEKFPPEINRKTPRKPSNHLRRNDWEALMQHDRLTGKLDLKSKEVFRDPGSVKRLLEAEMIDPHGKLTPEAREKCTLLTEKLQNFGSPGSTAPKPAGADRRVAPPGKKIMNVIPAHWAVLMQYDRKTGNLLKIDPQTGRLDKNSRLLLKNPSVIQRLVDKNLILPGGWLTPQAKKGCVRIEKKIKVQAADDDSGARASLKRKSKDDSNLEPQSKGRPNLALRSKSGTKSAIRSGRQPGSERDLQVFFEDLPNDVTIAGAEPESYSGYELQGEEDLQGFFENLPDDALETLDPDIYFAYDWKDERDLQAYFENLPRHFSDSRVIARSGRESAKS